MNDVTTYECDSVLHLWNISSNWAKYYKTINPYSDEPRPLYFISDVPHLMKTTRKFWANCFAHSYSRTLWVSILGKFG